MPEQIKVVLPKSKAPSPSVPEVEKHPKMTIAMLERRIDDLCDIIYTLEQRLHEEHVHRKSLARDIEALNHYVVKMKR